MAIPAGCNMCSSAKETGYWGQDGNTHCRACHKTWKMLSRQAHCVYCHRHFTSPSGFDAHLKTGTDGKAIFHLDPLASKGQLPYARNEEGAWYSPRPDDTYPHDPARAVLGPPTAGSSTPLDLDAQAYKFEPAALAWLPKSIS